MRRDIYKEIRIDENGWKRERERKRWGEDDESNEAKVIIVLIIIIKYFITSYTLPNIVTVILLFSFAMCTWKTIKIIIK